MLSLVGCPPGLAVLAVEAAVGDVVVVSHVSPIKAAITWALGVGDEVGWRMFLADAAVCRIDTSGQRPVLVSFGEMPGAVRRQA
ncbi:MAG: histidine phosphatase family protein [Pseudonocardia sp.]